MPRLALALAACAAALGAAPAARAATATTVGGELRYTALAGEANDVRITRVAGNTFRVTERGTTVTAGEGCTQESPNQVTCTTSRRLVVRVGDGNDRALIATSRAAVVHGEDGDDLLRGGSGGDRLEGDAGADHLFGARGGDALRGGGGNDWLDGGIGRDSVHGGDGDDTVYEGPVPNGADTLDGGAGFDTLDYSRRRGPVRIDPNGVRDDGDLYSSEADAAGLTFDRLLGGAGSDFLFGRDGLADELVGGAGGDIADGRRGDDRVDAGPGIDQVRARDLSSDTIACGDELDSVAADGRDEVAPDCERVRRTASVSVAPAAPPASPTLLVRVSCPVTAFVACSGRLVVRTARRVRTRRGPRVLVVGRRAFTVEAGGARLVGIRIRAAGRRLVARSRRGLPVRLSVSGSDAAGPARPATRRLTLR